MSLQKKHSLQAKIVKIKWVGTEMHDKIGVVMDDNYFYNGRICCRVISGSEVFCVEAEKLQIINVDG